MSLFYGGEATQSNRRVALSAQCTGLVHSEEMHSAHGMQVFSGRLRYRSRRAWRFCTALPNPALAVGVLPGGVNATNGDTHELRARDARLNGRAR